MKKAVFILVAIFLTVNVHAQKTKSTKKSFNSKSTAVKRASRAEVQRPEVKEPLDEAAEYEKASSSELASERIEALKKFLAHFPESQRRPDAIELIASSRVLVAEEKLFTGDVPGATAMFKLAVEEGPDPFTNEFFYESISRIPSSLYWRGARAEGLTLAALIEKRAAASPTQLIELANFYVGIENGAEALRIGQAAAVLDEKSEAAQRLIALAHRLNFDLDESAKAYARALEIDPASVTAKRGLAEMKRALGKPEEAVPLYRELLEKDENDLPSRTGLVLSLFNAGKRSEAESEMASALKATPSNVILLAGAAYWYATQNEGNKAVELAKKAIELEPRYIWSHIALARGLMSQKKPIDSEQTLISARRYGNFPTLEYELASARAMAGFYREAAEELRKSFTIVDGAVQTKLGGRVARSEKNLADLIAYERRASIFEPASPDTAEQSAQLKALLEFTEKLNAPTPDEAAVSAAADAFVGGSDKMKLHRQIYAANSLLRKKIALDKVLELSNSAVGNTEAGLEAPNAAAAVMASELYEPRSTAFSRSEFLLIPDVPKQTLSAILRGRIEDTIGWTLYQQNKFQEATVRLRRAISVLPDKSAWWRVSMWRLGAALEADGKEKEALDAYIQSYKTDRPDFAKFVVVESLYKRVNGSTEGLERQIGSERMAGTTAAATETLPVVTPSPSPDAATQLEVPKLQPRSFSIPKSVPIGGEIKADSLPKASINEKSESIQLTAEIPDKSVSEKTAENPQPIKTEAPAEIKPETTKEETASVDSKKPASTVKEEAELPDAETKTDDQQSDGGKKLSVDLNAKAEPEKAVTEKSKKTEIEPSAVKLVESKSSDSAISKPEAPTEPKAENRDQTAEVKLDKTDRSSEPKSEKTDPPSELKAEEKTSEKETPAPNEEAKKNDIPAEELPAKTVEKKTEEPNPGARRDEAEKKVEETSSEEPEPRPPSEKPALQPKQAISEPAQPETDSRAKAPPAEAEKSSESAEPPKRKAETKTTVVVTDNLRAPSEIGKKSSAAKPSEKSTALEKSLFEPIVIGVPDKSSRAEPGVEAKDSQTPRSEERKPELVPGPNAGGLFRPRVIEFGEAKGKPCSITASRDTISIAANGGRVGLLLSLDGDADIAAMNAKASSTDDLEVTAEPEIAGLENQRVFIIRSISRNRGVYWVAFEMSCGRKEVAVSVK